MRGASWLTIAFFASAAPMTSRADTSAATALFHEARHLLAVGEVAPACALFERAQGIAPGLGIELNLAECWARLGRTASAWRAFLRVADEAGRKGDRRAGYAQNRATAIAPLLARVVVSVEAPPPGLTVRVNGEPVDPGLLGVAVPVDPGEQQIVVAAPEHHARDITVMVLPANTMVVRVPALERNAQLPRSDAPPILDAARAPRPRERRDRQRLIGTAIAATGAAALAATGTLVLLADRQYDAAVESHCDGAGSCDNTGAAAIRSARTKGTIATVTGTAGVAAVVAGAVLYFTAPKRAGIQVLPSGSADSLGVSIEARW